MQSKRTKSELLDDTKKSGVDSYREDDDSNNDVSPPTTPEFSKKKRRNIK